MKFRRGHDHHRLNILPLSQCFDAVVGVLDFEFGGDLLGALQVGVGNRDQLRLGDQAANILGVLLAHRADPNYSHAQLRHN